LAYYKPSAVKYHFKRKIMIKNIFRNTVLFSTILLLNCSAKKDCLEGINLLPMYGEVKKCQEQTKIDAQFLADCDKQFKNRNEAAQSYIGKAWEGFYNNDPDISMKRFNQAWLLDKNNPEIYWGFGNLMGIKHELKKSISLFEKSIKLEPHNSKVYESMATSYGQLFFETKNVEYLDLTVKNLKTAINLDPNNAKIYGSLTSAYAYYIQKDSLRKYIKITDKLDPKIINSEVRKIADRN
jgi:tetratricopeptide (TPR) repeat protein